MGDVREASGAVSPLCAGLDDRHRQAVVHRPADSGGEIWAYNALGDQMRFTLVQRTPRPGEEKTQPAAPAPTASARPPSACVRPPGERARDAPSRSCGGAPRKRRQDDRSRAAPPERRRSRPARDAEAEVGVRALPARDPRQAWIRDHLSLMHWLREGSRQRSRILYVFRSPAACASAANRWSRTSFAISSRHPEISFDWKTLFANQQLVEMLVRAAPTAEARTCGGRALPEPPQPQPPAGEPEPRGSSGSAASVDPASLQGATPDEQIAF